MTNISRVTTEIVTMLLLSAAVLLAASGLRLITPTCVAESLGFGAVVFYPLCGLFAVALFIIAAILVRRGRRTLLATLGFHALVAVSVVGVTFISFLLLFAKHFGRHACTLPPPTWTM